MFAQADLGDKIDIIVLDFREIKVATFHIRSRWKRGVSLN